MSAFVSDGMDQGSVMDAEDRIERTVDIYVSAEMVRDIKHKKEMQDFDTQTPKTDINEGGKSVMSRRSRAASVCLVLVCVLLLTTVIVLSVVFITRNESYSKQTNELHNKITNLTGERDQLLIKNINLTDEADQLRKLLLGGWILYQSSLYYMSNERKNWTESRRDCVDRGADLIIINNREEQDFVMNITCKKEFWIGATDEEKEGSWKWVDGTTVTPTFWASGEPNGGRSENCAVTYLKKDPDLTGWLDVECSLSYQWMCERSISPFIKS